MARTTIDYAYTHGINYFDTAWGYHNGNSELTAGKFLSRYPVGIALGVSFACCGTLLGHAIDRKSKD